MVKIFQMGSCRTSFGNLKSKNCYFKNNYDLTHTSKEIFTYLDLFNNTYDISTMPHPEYLMYNPKNFKPNLYYQYLNSSNIVTIEISSLKLIKFNNFYYQINRERDFRSRDTVAERIIQSEEDLISDIKKIEQRINKPVIFFGHINSDFYDVPNINGYIEDRQILDNVL